MMNGDRELNRTLRNARITTILGLSIKSLITGLSLDLKQSGNDIINADYKPKKLKPSIPVKSKPW